MNIQEILAEERVYRNVPGIFPDGPIGFTFHYDDERSIERNIPVDKILNMCKSAYREYPRDILYLHDEAFVIEDAENFEDGDVLRTMATPESELMTKEIAKTVNDTMMALPDDLRTAITLREIEGLSYEEIASVMDCPIGTVRSRIFRARETIAAKLRPLLDTPENKRW